MSAERAVMVRFDKHYGQLRCYPANEAASLLCLLTGTKTLASGDLMVARKLGFEIVVQYQSWALLEEYLGVTA